MEDPFILELDRQIFLNVSVLMNDIAGQFDREIDCSSDKKTFVYCRTSSIAFPQLRAIEIIKNDGIMEVL